MANGVSFKGAEDDVQAPEDTQKHCIICLRNNCKSGHGKREKGMMCSSSYPFSLIILTALLRHNAHTIQSFPKTQVTEAGAL